MKALAFASKAHEKQVRKYTLEPYIYHPIEVAETLVNAFPSNPPPPYVLAAALLHDVVEDCEVSFTELRREFNDDIAMVVMHLTDLVTKEQGNRETRKLMEASRLRCAPLDAQVIKIADMISNTKSICIHDRDFARVYLPEKERSLEAIRTSWVPFAEQYSQNVELMEFFFNAIAMCNIGRMLLDMKDEVRG